MKDYTCAFKLPWLHARSALLNAEFCREISQNKPVSAAWLYLYSAHVLAEIYILNSGTEESFMRQTKLISKPKTAITAHNKARETQHIL